MISQMVIQQQEREIGMCMVSSEKLSAWRMCRWLMDPSMHSFPHHTHTPSTSASARQQVILFMAIIIIISFTEHTSRQLASRSTHISQGYAGYQKKIKKCYSMSSSPLASQGRCVTLHCFVIRVFPIHQPAYIHCVQREELFNSLSQTIYITALQDIYFAWT